jgi:hypothetical protein
MTVKSVPTYNWYTLVEVGIISDWQYFWKMSVVKIRQIGEYEILEYPPPHADSFILGPA